MTPDDEVARCRQRIKVMEDKIGKIEDALSEVRYLALDEIEQALENEHQLLGHLITKAVEAQRKAQQ